MSFIRPILPLLLVLPIMIAGCGSISIPLGGSSPEETAALTGPNGEAVKVEQPLPPALAYSDAAVIGKVAGESAFDQVSEESIDWVNGATGSSGTWKGGPQITAGGNEECRAFGATVTSVRGVHRFSGVACRDQAGNLSVKSLSDKPVELPAPTDTSEVSG
jgi:hypothetical protein